MAIYSQVFRKDGFNDAALAFGADTAARWATGRLRVRLTEAERHRYGAMNVMRIVNKSSKKIRVHFTWGISNERYEDMEASSIRNITVDDGYNFYGFDIETLDTAADIAIGDVRYTATRVEQIKEGG